MIFSHNLLFLFVSIFLTLFDAGKTSTKKGVTRPETFDLNLENVDADKLKSVLCSVLQSTLAKTIKNPEIGPSRVIQISKNLKFMSFPESVEVNDLNALRTAAKECEEILGVLRGQIEMLKSQPKAKWD